MQDLQLEALRSTELSGGLGRPSGREDLSSPPSLASVGKTGSGINPELMDLTCMLSPGSPSVSPDSQREEVAIQSLFLCRHERPGIARQHWVMQQRFSCMRFTPILIDRPGMSGACHGV